MSSLAARYPALTRSIRPVTRSRPLPCDPTGVVLGRDRDGFPLSIPLRSRLEHVFMLGATGSGKSRLLLHYASQLARLGEGLLLLDPHGTLAADFLYALRNVARPIHVIDLASEVLVGFNPLELPPGTDASVIVGNLMDALSVVWEGESFSQKPSIERVMSAALIACSELGLTLADAEDILDHKDETGARRRAIERVRDMHTRRELVRLDELSRDGRRRRDFDAEVVGPLNRLARLLRPPVLRAMLTRQKSTLDLRAVMDAGGIIVASLAGGAKAYERDADLFGRVLIRSALFHASRRSTATPFSLVIDEASRFLSSDTPQLLAEVRKYSVSVVAAMQWLEQARTQDENILQALLNTGVKVVFRLRDSKDAEIMARDMVPVEIERPVQALIKPTVVGHRIRRLGNESASENSSETVSETYTLSKARADTQSSMEAFSVSEMASVSEAETSTEMSSESAGSSISAGATASEIAIPTQDPNNPHITRVVNGESSFDAESASSSEGTARSVGEVRTSGTQTTETLAFGSAKTITEGHAHGTGNARQTGRGSSKGSAEALEPILEDRPSAVHSVQTELYRAGLMLRSLPTGTGYCAYVGPRGPVATLFSVPPVFTASVSQEDLLAARNGIVARSTSAISVVPQARSEPAQGAGEVGRLPGRKRRKSKPRSPEHDTHIGSETSW